MIDSEWLSIFGKLEAVALRYAPQHDQEESMYIYGDGLQLTPMLSKLHGEHLRSVTMIMDMKILGHGFSTLFSMSQSILRNVDSSLSDFLRFPVLEEFVILVENCTLGSDEHRKMTGKVLECLPQMGGSRRLKVKR